MSKYETIYRDVPMARADELIMAGAYLDREWGSYGRRLGYAGHWHGHAVFQCIASDGSRWLIRVNDQTGSVGTFERELEREVAHTLRVEVSG